MKEKDWKSTTTQHLIQHVPSGRYYVRLKVKGKIVRQSLKTSSISVAMARLPDRIKEIRFINDAMPTENIETLGDCLDMVIDKARHKAGLRDSSRHYRQMTLLRIRDSWPDIENLKPKDISPRQCEDWFKAVSARYSHTLANNMLGTLRMAFELARRSGIIYRDPTEEIKRSKVEGKHLILPDPTTFKAFVAAIRHPKGVKRLSWHSGASADLVEFLAYSGARINEARNVRWSDVDVRRGMIHLRETKGGVTRWVPMIPPMVELIKRLPRKGEYVVRVDEAEKSMTRAAKEIGMARVTHHDLRHLFATTCIERGVDIPTVARWLGHKDGGALALRTYGHLRACHSEGSAAKVLFE